MGCICFQFFEFSSKERLKLSFTAAEEHLDVKAILDVDDMVSNPDAKSVQLYVSYLYNKLKHEQIDGNRLETEIAMQIEKRNIGIQNSINQKNAKIEALIVEFEGIFEYLPDIQPLELAREKKEIVDAKFTEVEEARNYVNDVKINYPNFADETVRLFDTLRYII